LDAKKTVEGEPLPGALSTGTLTVLVRELLRATGSVELPVTGSSMGPFLRSGDVLTLRRLPRARLGDVVARRVTGDRLLIHRVVGHRGSDVLTRGDAVARADPPGPGDSILGSVVGIERAGAAVRLGLGPERIAIALLSRWGLLLPLLRPLRALWRLSHPR